MQDINRWLRRQAAREGRTVVLEDALLADRFWPYAAYRLRYFFARYISVSAVHAIRVFILFRVFSTRDFVFVIAAQTAAGLLGSFWWGGLEVMRSRVRTLFREGRPYLISREIGSWLSLAAFLCLVGLAGAAGFAGWRVGSGGLGARDAYLLAIGLGLALELPARCYHSGAYAVRRIYRPLASMLVVQLVSLGGLALLLPWLRAWSFAIVTLAASLVSVGLTLLFTGRVYRFLGFTPEAHLDLRLTRLRLRGATGELLAAGASYSVLAMDSWLVLALFGTSAGTRDRAALFTLFFVVSPTVRAGFEWALLLYFDLKRLEVGVFANLKRRFEAHAVRLAWLLGVVFWALACSIGTAVYGGSLGSFYWLSAPFFLSRSLLALAQMRAFADRAYGRVLASGAVLLPGIVVLRLTLHGEQATVLGLAAVTLLGLAAVRTSGRILARVQGRELLWLSEWLARAQEVAEPVRIRVAVLDGDATVADRERTNEWLHRRLGTDVARRLAGSGAATLISPDRIAWYERARAPRPSKDWLAAQCGGFIRELHETVVHDEGASALEAACRDGLLGAEIGRGWSRPASADPGEVERSFERLFPDGVVYASDRPAPQLLNELPSGERRLVMFNAALYAREFRTPRTRSRFDVTAFCPGGELRLIFLVDRRAERRLRRRWHRRIAAMNVRASRLDASLALGARAP